MSSSMNSSSPTDPSLKYMGDSRASSPFSDSGVIQNPVQPMDAGETSPSHKRHAQFYFIDGNVVFLAEDTLYKVHRYFFQRDSCYFRGEFEGHLGSPIGDATDEYPLILSNVKSNDFDAFLSVLYPTDFRRPDDKTTAEWTSILHLAAQWGFETIKLLAIERLTATATPIDKIVLGRRYSISEWLAGAYEAVCSRADPLTIEEGTKLGMEDMVRISAVRQAYGYAAARYERNLLHQDLHEIFGFELDVQDVQREELAIKELEEQIAGAAAEIATEAPPISEACCGWGRYLREDRCNSRKCPEHELLRQQKVVTAQKAREQETRRLQLTKLKAGLAERERQRHGQQERVSFFQ